MGRPHPVPAPAGASAEALADLLSLLRAWATGATPAPLRGGTLPVLALAEAHELDAPVREALSRVLPEAAAALLCAPGLEAERVRAEALAAQFRDVMERLVLVGAAPVALKGAAFLADAAGAAAPWRPMIDFDVLVEPPALPRAVQALHEAGYRAEDAAHVPTDYHYPALMPPAGGAASVELHVRLDWSRRGPLAEAASRAQVSALSGVRVLAPEDRLAHLTRHAMVADRGLRRRSLRLRDALDWHVLTGAGADPEAARERLLPGEEQAGFDAFAALMGRVWGGAPGAAEAEAWAKEALLSIADPERAALYAREDGARWLWDQATTRETLAHALQAALNPARLRRIMRNWSF
ncbi:MAG: nucleotidyltransferase family protein [Pseudomonadota bacterium]